MRKGGDGEGAWGGEELLVECTKGITRKCKNLVHDFFLSYFLTVSQYCMQTDFLSWSCSDCSVFFASQIIRGVAVRCTERALDASRERSIHQKRRTASCWRHWQLVPNIIILSSWMRHITPSATPTPSLSPLRGDSPLLGTHSWRLMACGSYSGQHVPCHPLFRFSTSNTSNISLKQSPR